MTDQFTFGVETTNQIHFADRPEYAKAFQTMTLEERLAAGRAARERTPRSSHAEWQPAPDRPDPVAILEAQNATRMPEYVPIRMGRMLASPFAFLRGAAAIMAQDLSCTPNSGIITQLCGDCHLANFGVFASQERNLIFGINDYDETLPGPWEWDVKRLAVSFAVAGRFLGLNKAVVQGGTLAALGTYRKHMREYARMGYLALYYSRIDDSTLVATLSGNQRAGAERLLAKARQRTHLQVLEKQTELIDGDFRIVETPPLVVRPPERLLNGELFVDVIGQWLRGYRSSLAEERRVLLDRYHVVDVVLKVVGVGSVGTRCYVVLLRGQDENDPLFLQVKEAQPSVLEAYVAPSTHSTPGQRVVAGQRLIQPAPDIFLGWCSDRDPLQNKAFHYYVRQLRDMKGGVEFIPGSWKAPAFTQYASICGWALALAHARAGDPAMIAGYLGNSARFDEAVAQFAEAYADQTERDYAALAQAVKEGRVEAVTGQ